MLRCQSFEVQGCEHADLIVTCGTRKCLTNRLRIYFDVPWSLFRPPEFVEAQARIKRMRELRKKRICKSLKSLTLNARAPQYKIEIAAVHENLRHEGPPEYWSARGSKVIE